MNRTGNRSFLCYNSYMKTIVWDFNGTIVDDTQTCLDIENEMLRKRNMKHDFTIEEYRDHFCFPVINYYYWLGYTFENESYDDISVEFNDMYDKHFPSCRLCEGFQELISLSVEKGYKNIILSATREDRLIRQVKELKIDHYFDELLGIGDLLAGGKTGRALEWMKESGTDPDECIYIGDTTHDAETAKALGIKRCILVSCGHQSFDVLDGAAGETLHSLKEVIL